MPDGSSTLPLVLAVDSGLLEIVRLSLIVSLAATALAALIGFPLGAFLALVQFPGRTGVIVVLNAFMGLPRSWSAWWLTFSCRGPAHWAFNLLFSPPAMIVAQSILVLPILASLARQTIEDLWSEYRNELTALQVRPMLRVKPCCGMLVSAWSRFCWRASGRAAAEVGTVMIVGGNIEGFTRTMTTAIALETSKGDLPLAIGLGLVLITIVIAINAMAWGVRRIGEIRAGRTQQRTHRQDKEQKMLNRRFLIAAVLTVAVAVPVSAQEKWIVVASTTSTRTRASLATFFRCSSRTGIDVKVIAQGTGRPSKLRDAAMPMWCSFMPRRRKKNSSLTALA